LDKKKVTVACGYTHLDLDVPQHSMIVDDLPREKSPSLSDPVSACREALETPHGMERISDLVKKGSKVTIAINNHFGPSAIVAPLVLDELKRAGVSDTDITFMSAAGAWPKLTREQFLMSGPPPCPLLPPDIVDRFWPPGTVYPRGIRSHDAADPKELVFLGYTNLGDFVECNRVVAESDLLIYIGWGAWPLGLWGGYGGAGVVIGLGSARSIGSHHSWGVVGHPNSSHGDPRNHFYRRHKEAIMQHIEDKTGKQVFYVDGTPNLYGQWAAFHAGHWKAIQELEWAISDKEKIATIPHQADVVIKGGPMVGSYDLVRNPIASMAEATAQLKCYVGQKPPLREGGVIIHLTPVDGTIEPRRISDREVIDLYRKTGYNSQELTKYEDDFYTRPEYLHKYMHGHAFHPIHPFYLFYAYVQYALDHASKIISVGAGDPAAASEVGYRPARNFEEAWRMAEQIVGKDPNVLVLPGTGKRVMKVVLNVGS